MNLLTASVTQDLSAQRTLAHINSAAAAPVRRSERIESLDVLRGFALLGILLANIQDFASPASIMHDIPLPVVLRSGTHPTLDLAVMTGQWLFVEGKMRALFSMLFGAGTVLLTQRLEQQGQAPLAADIFHRRNMWLLVFGLIHGLLIWSGDILLFYSSMTLLVLYPLRHVGAKWLIGVGLATLLLGGTVGIINALGIWEVLPTSALQEQALANTRAGRPLSAPERAALQEAKKVRTGEVAAVQQKLTLAHRGFAAQFATNKADEVGFVTLVFQSGWSAEVIGLLLLGMGLFKTGFFSARFPSRRYLLLALVSYGIAIPLLLIGLYRAQQAGFSDAVTLKWLFLPYTLTQLFGMLANASVVLLLVRSGRLRRVQNALAAVGRMAFSNYIITSLLGRFIFLWGPWQLYGTLQYYQQLYVVLAIWTFNFVFSILWLRFFAFGPLEWLWRSLTYWQRQPLRLTTAA